MAVTLFFYYLPPYFKALENYLLSIWNSYFPETSSIFSNLFSLSNTNRTEGHDDIRLRGNAITIFFYHFFSKRHISIFSKHYLFFHSYMLL